MSPFRSSRFSCLAGALILAASLCAHGAELGEPALRSHIGQNLIADIELTGMGESSAPVQVRIASPDVYRGANIAMPAVLGALHLSVMRRDGRQFLHVISTRPINADHLNLFLELNDGARRHVRAVTLWLTPDPQPAPAPPAPAVAAPTVSAAFPKSAPPQAALPQAPSAPRTAQALPPRLRVPAPAPAACAPVDAEQLRICAALDYKNGMLQARIVELEEKVKALQLAIDGHAEAAPVASAPAKPTPIPPPPQARTFPWLFAGAGLGGLGALAGLIVFLRRKKARLKGAPPKPGMLAGLATKFARKGKVAPAVE